MDLFKLLVDKFFPNYDFIYQLFKCKFRFDTSDFLGDKWLGLLWDIIFGKIDLSKLFEEIFDPEFFKALMDEFFGNLVSGALLNFLRNIFELILGNSVLGSLAQLLLDFIKGLVYGKSLSDLFKAISDGLIDLINQCEILGIENILIELFNRLVELTLLEKINLDESAILKLLEEISGLSIDDFGSSLIEWILATWASIKLAAEAALLPSIIFRLIRNSDEDTKKHVYSVVADNIRNNNTSTGGLTIQDLAELIAEAYKRRLYSYHHPMPTACVDHGFVLEKFISSDAIFGSPTITATRVNNLKQLYSSLLVPVLNYYRPIMNYDCLLYIIYGLCSERFARGRLRGSTRDGHTNGEAVDFMIAGVNSYKVKEAIESGLINIPYGTIGRGNAGIHISLRRQTSEIISVENSIIK